MLIAGDPSGDQLAAELVTALRVAAPDAEFFGAGGPQMAAAGVALSEDLTRHAVIGLVEALRKYAQLRRIFWRLMDEAKRRRPEVWIGVDYGGFNLRFARALRAAARAAPDWPLRIVQFVSPQVWASRPGRAQVLAANHDLLLSILPFEKAWYAKRATGLPVEYVGHPLVDRHGIAPQIRDVPAVSPDVLPTVLLLPGSRRGELRRHWPVLKEAAARIAAAVPVRLLAVLPTEDLAMMARADGPAVPGLEIQVGGLSTALQSARIALASTGTVTLECAWFRVPTIALYRTSWSTYQVGKRIITVPYLAMPNLLAGEAVMPEFVQQEATGKNLAEAAIALLLDPARHAAIQEKLGEVVAQLGEAGACQRAAAHILALPR